MTSSSDQDDAVLAAGRVWFVGAGPGDPGLLTLRGADLLARADVVLYDYLANPDLLDHVSPDAECICLGRHGTGRIWPQTEVNQRLVEMSRAGKSVVRLKSGDPGIFARLAEETAYLDQHDVGWEVVPGITAAMASGSYAGIPLTHRDHASSVAFVTGKENSAKSGESLDYQALACFPGTLVFYMAVTTAPRWVSALLDAGKHPDTPVAVVRRCSFSDQQTIRCTLSEVIDRLTPYKRFPPPAIAIVGDVAGIETTTTWFQRRPLFGQTVLVTRPAVQAAAFRNQLRDLGATVTIHSAIEILPPDSWQPVDDLLGRLGQYDWLVFSSANGVRCFFDRLWATGMDARRFGQARLAAIGQRTADALASLFLKTDLQPDEYRAEALAEALAANAAGRRFLLVRASRGREVLAESLMAAGATVDQVVVYRSVDGSQPRDELFQRLEEGELDWITVTSSAIARSLVHQFGDRLRLAKLASISPVTTATLRELGHEVAVEASEYTMDGVIAAMVGDG